MKASCSLKLLGRVKEKLLRNLGFPEPLRGERRQRVGFQNKPVTELPLSLGANAGAGPGGQQSEAMEDSVPGDTKILRKRAVEGDGNSKKAQAGAFASYC